MSNDELLKKIGEQTGNCYSSDCKAYNLFSNWCEQCKPIVVELKRSFGHE